ncbi:hypothetical protein wTpre_188 [Wolbachia endosymbiont of Trichogramma pretiosum]|nr:hypothetical protein wTpre_188 [Wolbachia endosymbiont of Trichogramma pretiosum]
MTKNGNFLSQEELHKVWPRKHKIRTIINVIQCIMKGIYQ